MKKQQKSEIEVKFYLCSLSFEPYAELKNDYDSRKIIKSIIDYIMIEQKESKGILIDRYKNRETNERRELFMNSCVYVHKDRKIRCSIALLRSGKKPLLKPKDKYKLVSISDLGTPAEETSFYIDMDSQIPILCVEYNHFGPRLKDIEYYLRHIARDILHISKVTSLNIFINNNIADTLEKFKNVLNFEMKINPNDLEIMDKHIRDKYFTHIKHLGHFLKPNFVKIEALFQTQGKTYESIELNKNANNMFVELLQLFKGRPFNIDVFENFIVKYESKDGEEEFFNLLNNKESITIEFDFETSKKREMYELVV